MVDTTNFTERPSTKVPATNCVVERFSRIDDKTLLYRFTIEGPETWDRPWTGEYPWVKSDEMLYEYACHEGNHAMENVLSSARAVERQQSGQKP